MTSGASAWRSNVVYCQTLRSSRGGLESCFPQATGAQWKAIAASWDVHRQCQRVMGKHSKCTEYQCMMHRMLLPSFKFVCVLKEEGMTESAWRSCSPRVNRRLIPCAYNLLATSSKPAYVYVASRWSPLYRIGQKAAVAASTLPRRSHTKMKHVLGLKSPASYLYQILRATPCDMSLALPLQQSLCHLVNN